jgi:uncharacterized membrane protein
MIIDFVSLFENIPKEVATVLTAMTPIGELRAALPIALTVYDMPFWQAYLFSVVGNMIPVALILWFFDPISQWLMKYSQFFRKFFEKLFEKTRSKHSAKFEKWGALALITFVAIPLPVTGAWTGSLAALLFGIPFKKAFPTILLGVMIAGVIVAALAVGLDSII